MTTLWDPSSNTVCSWILTCVQLPPLTHNMREVLQPEVHIVIHLHTAHGASG
jgi:hypothetical protein